MAMTTETMREAVARAMEEAFFASHEQANTVFASPAECWQAMLDAAVREVGLTDNYAGN